MNEPQQGMSDEFKSRMRRGLSSMAVRERVRERRRTRAIAGGALAAVVVATAAVFGSQALGNMNAERDQAGPATTQTPTAPTPQPTETEPVDTEPAETEPAETEPAGPTLPPGLVGVAAGEPRVIDTQTCDGCGDTGAAGGPTIEGSYDLYILCEGIGEVRYGGEPWIDCSDYAPGTGFSMLDTRDYIDDGDPQYTGGDDFTGDIQVVEPGVTPRGQAGGTTAIVYATCSDDIGIATIGGIEFDCADAAIGDTFRSAIIAAWGVPIEPGELAPRIVRNDAGAHIDVNYVVER